MPREFVKYNLNNYVKVKLTEKGRGIYQEHLENQNILLSGLGYPQSDLEPEVDEEGYITLQGIELIDIFGAYFNQYGNLLFETNMLIDVGGV